MWWPPLPEVLRITVYDWALHEQCGMTELLHNRQPQLCQNSCGFLLGALSLLALVGMQHLEDVFGSHILNTAKADFVLARHKSNRCWYVISADVALFISFFDFMSHLS
jgi:hypothetical protein